MKHQAQKIVRHLAEQLRAIRPGRLEPGTVATFRVAVGNGSVPLGKVAAITPQGDRILVRPFDPAHIGSIVAALTEARWSAYAADPRTVAIGIPAPSVEQRRELARHVKKLGEEAKVAVRLARQDARKQIDASGRGSQRFVQEATDTAVAEIDALVRARLEELER